LSLLIGSLQEVRVFEFLFVDSGSVFLFLISQKVLLGLEPSKFTNAVARQSLDVVVDYLGEVVPELDLLEFVKRELSHLHSTRLNHSVYPRSKYLVKWMCLSHSVRVDT
jgi:hypothetical protein